MILERPTLGNAVLASLLAGGLATGLGALPVVAIHTASARVRAALSGSGAGVMLAASVFSLLVPALEKMSGLRGSIAMASAVLLGAAVLAFANATVPHEHFLKGIEGSSPGALRRVWLLVLAMTIHNFPEGLAVGVGVASGEASIRLPITLGIGIQNMPEGFVVAASLAQEGYRRRTAIGVALLTGMVEPIGAAMGFLGVQWTAVLLPGALAFAAGAMLWVVSSEIIPESHRGEHATAATWGTLGGFVIMMILDTALGK